MKVGLRIDACTYRGTKIGVPKLCTILHDNSIKGSFFFSLGPDNMGRHIRRLFRPSFIFKMLRSNASALYGWDILFKGTLWPGPIIGEKLENIIRNTSGQGHEVGLHAWDHYAWQMNIEKMDFNEISKSLELGFNLLSKIIGRPPTCSAVASWQTNDATILAKNKFPFQYNSDCRGKSIFSPSVNGQKQKQPQVPVTLPTYDEVIDCNGVTKNNYNDYLLSLIKSDQLNVLAIHAEVEGIVCESLFRDFLILAKMKGIEFVPLSELLIDQSPIMTKSIIVKKEISGRDGWVSCQQSI